MAMQQSENGEETNRKQQLGYAALGGFLGVSFEGEAWGLISGAGLGLLYAQTRGLQMAIAALKSDRSPSISSASEPAPAPSPKIETPLPQAPVSQTTSVPTPPPTGPSPTPRPVQSEPVFVPPSDSSASGEAQAPMDTSRVQEWTPRDRPRMTSPAATGPGFLERLTETMSGILFGGNTVVRVGLFVLFVGLAMLAKYAVDHVYFPVEARLGAAALVGLGLTAFGYRQRLERPGFGMSLQGGGFAILYLVTFFSFRVYDLIGAELAFSTFAGLAISTALLAAYQKSEPLLVIGSLGGFAAPVIASTGSNDHVALFSYYLLLTFSIAAVAWWRSWRWPAWVAFVCVFGVATVWGVLRYQPERFSTTEPFLLAFVGLFTAIALMHALRRPPELRGLIDGTLVFGTPFIAILLQSALVREIDFGLAYSALGFALFYGALAIGLKRFFSEDLGALIQAFTALAIGFATMAIPFAFEDGLSTAIAWSLEGAGLYWVGAKQERRFPRFAGALLQPLAGIACLVGFGLDPIDSSLFVPIANGRALSFLALAGSALFVAHRSDLRQSDSESLLAWALGLSGLAWWATLCLTEIDQFVVRDWRIASAVSVTALSTLALHFGSSALSWKTGGRLALFGLPAAALMLLEVLEETSHILADGGFLAWPLLFAALAWIAWRQQSQPSLWTNVFQAGSFWLLAVFASMAALGAVEVEFSFENDWLGAAFGIGLAGVLLLGQALTPNWVPDTDPESEQRGISGWLFWAVGPVAFASLLTILVLEFWATGDGLPLRHLPILNPTDATVLILGVAISLWVRRLSVTSLLPGWKGAVTAYRLLAVAVGFLALNGTIARAVHQWTGVALEIDPLWESSAFHMSISIIWALLGFVAMWLASKKGWRSLWIGAAGLLSVVVLKLFLVDLAQLSTVTRIATFLAVGMLLLVLGYVSPVPPGSAEPDPDGPVEPEET